VTKSIKELGVEQKIWMNELISLDLERMIRAHLILTMYEASVQVVAQNNWKDQEIAKVLLLVN
jgi:hypothetical protein